ncbi:hypothetical protein GYB22_10955 [bacterium]|nr:hypothetical protein [bacterium]
MNYQAKFNQKYIAVCAATLLFNFNSCTYPEGPSLSLRTKQGRLLGKWEIAKIDGQRPGQYEFIMEFEKDGDLKYGQRNDTEASYSIGEWKWESDKEEIELEIEGNDFVFEIQRLTNSELLMEETEDNIEYELEKLDQ